MKSNKHIWEGCTVQDFIDSLELMFDLTHQRKPFKTREEVKRFCMENQPYYKKYIPEVVDYFYKKIKT